MQVKDVMTRTVEVVERQTVLSRAAQRMHALDIGMLPVMDGETVVGVITDRDMTVRALARGLDVNAAVVGEVMTREVVHCFDDQTVDTAAAIMGVYRIRRLVVLDRAQRLVGVVSLDDVATGVRDPTLAGETLKRASARPDRLRHGCQRILVTLDGSKFAERVLPSVELLAEKLGATVTLLQVLAPVQLPLQVEVYAGGAGPERSTSSSPDEARGDAVRYLTSVQTALQARGVTAECETVEGPASEVIVRRARQLGADLIAITTHGRTGVDRMVFGSVAEDVLRQTPCPVLLVRVHEEL
jgi:nucleotide-binding universal stress UspA family protein/CBS domain-containing protein